MPTRTRGNKRRNAKRRNNTRKKTRRVYRKRVKHSACRKKRGRTCNKMKSCKFYSL